VMDGRHFRFCLKVANREEHKKIAEKSNICTMYVRVSRQVPGGNIESTEIAAAVTSGTMNNLFIGKTGVFFTPDGDEWDAQTVDFIKQPVSFSEALRMPFGLLGDFIRRQSERFTTTRYKELESSIEKGLIQPQSATSAPVIAAPPQSQNNPGAPQQHSAAWNGSILMLGGGVGVAALGSSFAFITNMLSKVSPWSIMAVIAGVLLLIGGPVVIAAAVKLHRRNLGVFIEACGWSINAPMRLTRSMGLLFTCEPELPADVSRRRFELTRLLLKQHEISGHPHRKTFWVLAVLLAGLVLGFWLARALALDTRIIEFFKL